MKIYKFNDGASMTGSVCLWPGESLSKELQSCRCSIQEKICQCKIRGTLKDNGVKETGKQEKYAFFVHVPFVQAPIAVFSPWRYPSFSRLDFSTFLRFF